MDVYRPRQLGPGCGQPGPLTTLGRRDGHGTAYQLQKNIFVDLLAENGKGGQEFPFIIPESYSASAGADKTHTLNILTSLLSCIVLSYSSARCIIGEESREPPGWQGKGRSTYGEVLIKRRFRHGLASKTERQAGQYFYLERRCSNTTSSSRTPAQGVLLRLH